MDMPIFLNDLLPNNNLAAETFQGGVKIDVSKYPKRLHFGLQGSVLTGMFLAIDHLRFEVEQVFQNTSLCLVI